MIRTLSLPRGALLFAIAVLHLAALLGLQPRQHSRPEHAPRRGELVFVLPPAPPLSPLPPAAHARPAPRPPVSPSVTAAPRTVPDRERVPPRPVDAAEAGHDPLVATPRGEPATPPAGPAAADPFASPAPGLDTLLARSRHAAAGIDRDLRKERREKLVLREPELARTIGAAYIDRSHSVTETVLSNGDVIMKVRSPLGTYCWKKLSSLPVAGRDPFTSAGKQFAVQCPK